MKTNRIIIKQKLPNSEAPYKEDSPILIHYDFDFGWIVEMVVEGEYEIQSDNLMYEKHDEPDWDLVNEIRGDKEVWIVPKPKDWKS